MPLPPALLTLCNKVKSLSSQENFEGVAECLGKSTEFLKKQDTPALDEAFTFLDVHGHSLGVLAILCAKFSCPPILDPDLLHAQVREFITRCDWEQIRFAVGAFTDLCHSFTASLIENQQPFQGIHLLTKAICEVQLFPSQLTPLHADLCQLCLLSKCMKPALPFLDIDITDFSKESPHFDVKYVLLYYYYGGMIYTSLKNYERALYFFEMAVTTPSMAVSHIMVEAYKKHILVALILYGKVPDLPNYTSQVVPRFIKHLSLPYHNLATAYATNHLHKVREVIARHQDMYTEDNNMGLVKQCVSSLYNKNIQRLTKTFLTLSLSDMASRVHLSGPSEAEKYILNMIADGEISASINQKDGMVVFHDSSEKYNAPAMFKFLEDEMRKCVQLDEELTHMEQQIAVNPRFIQKVNAQSRKNVDFIPPLPSFRNFDVSSSDSN